MRRTSRAAPHGNEFKPRQKGPWPNGARWGRLSSPLARKLSAPCAATGLTPLQYRQEFAAILRREKMHDDQGGPDKKTRQALLDIMECKQGNVWKWHEELPQNERDRLTHPCSIWRRFKAAHAAPKPKKAEGALTEDEEQQAIEDKTVEKLAAH